VFDSHGKAPLLNRAGLWIPAYLFRRMENTFSCKGKAFGRDIRPCEEPFDPSKKKVLSVFFPIPIIQ